MENQIHDRNRNLIYQRRLRDSASSLVGDTNLQNNMENKNSSSTDSKNWGGARSGAGRKAIPHGKAYNFRSTPEVDEILSALGSNKCKYINDAILYYSKLQK